MLKTAAAAVTMLLVTAAPAALAQNAPARESNGAAVDPSVLTDVRVHVIKAALQLKGEQEKLWPAVEAAIRSRAKDRQERIAKIRERADNLHERGAREFFSNPDPIAFLNRRAGALAQRSAGLKKLAEAWEPLYRTLDSDQKQRMRFVAIFMLAEVREAVGRARDDDFDDE